MQKPDRFILFRSSPYRPLFEGGLGFRTPPSPVQYSRMSKREKKRWRLWEFTQWELADQLRKAMNKKDHADLVEVGKAPRTIYVPPSLAKKRDKQSSLEALA